jgi:hypothetical protein
LFVGGVYSLTKKFFLVARGLFPFSWGVYPLTILFAWNWQIIYTVDLKSPYLRLAGQSESSVHVGGIPTGPSSSKQPAKW